MQLSRVWSPLSKKLYECLRQRTPLSLKVLSDILRAPDWQPLLLPAVTQAFTICVSEPSNIVSDLPGAVAEPPLALDTAGQVSLGRSQTTCAGVIGDLR